MAVATGGGSSEGVLVMTAKKQLEMPSVLPDFKRTASNSAFTLLGTVFVTTLKTVNSNACKK